MKNYLKKGLRGLKTKPKIMISFTEGGENGGPYISHKRIMESSLKDKYEFIPLIIPKGRIGVFNISLLRKLRKDILKANPDIVHFTGLQLTGFHVALACKLVGIQNTILAIRGSSLEAINFPGWKKRIVNILEISTLKLSRVCYGVSEYVCSWERVQNHSNWCYGHIYNIPSDKKRDEVYSNSYFREEIDAKFDDILIVSTGRITREKGFEVLLNVIKNMNIPDDVKFVIAGEGEFFDTFKNEIEQNNLTDTVFLLGYRNDIDSILQSSDIFVLCTLHETLCNSIIEAGYFSLPTVATRVGGIPEIVEDGYNGFLVDKYNVQGTIDALQRLIKDKTKRENMGKNAKKIIDNKFSKEKIVQQIDDLYRRLLENGGR
jgi:glycosyltransferase involved in cell wall biosynthesis